MHGRQNRLRNSCATEKRPALRNKEPAQSDSGGKRDGGLLQSAATNGGRANERAEFGKPWKVCTFVSFFCRASFSDQFPVVAVPPEEAGDFLPGNLWSDFGRGPRGPGLPGATICASGAGPRHPARRAAAVRASAVRGASSKIRRAHHRTNCFAEICERRGVTGAGAK